jgi:hypothetical protein
MVWKITADELWFRYADGERDFRGIELIQSEAEREIGYFPISLRGFNLRESKISAVFLLFDEA